MSSAREPARLVITTDRRPLRVLTLSVSLAPALLAPPADQLFQNPVNFSRGSLVGRLYLVRTAKRGHTEAATERIQGATTSSSLLATAIDRRQQRNRMNLGTAPIDGRVIIVTGASS